ncbi:TIGR03545 family protein [Aliikangiella coralliicola]|uniref:TIGR03545 family protein n=1 Tax=Aliikangiella coralliicola TaxID=2592383 RepID=A0A545UG14_9GAMM|nr:TIGR03545 family protein [Aliikangiella coralliicola]TQV88416.1 TIGR03545 family protein [Aliikangiella coralliicola]
MKIIRWWGVITFFVLLLILTLVWYLLAPVIIADSIEDLGSEALGAKVEVDSVDLSLFPVAVSLNHLTAADPEQPMKNLLDTEQIKFSLDAGALLWKKLVIDELILTGVKTATDRATSGALEGGRKTGQAIQNAIEMALPDMEQLDINSVVDNADLITLKRVDEFKQSQAKIKQEWEKALDKKAFAERTDAIKSEYERLSKRAKDNKLNLIKDRKDWKKLKKSIDAERKQIASLSDKIKQDKKTLAEQLKSVKNGPGDDLTAVMDKFGLGSGVEGLVDKYLGPKYTPWVMRAVEFAKQFKSDGSSGEEEVEQAAVQVGKKVYFKDEHTFPELLIKKINLSGSDQGWELDGKGFDLGYLPWLTGKPAKLNIQFGGKGDAKVDLSSDWPSADKMSTELKSVVSSWPIESMQFMETKEGSWVVNSGVLSANVVGELTLEKIDLEASFSIQSPKLSVPDGISDWQKSLATSVNQQAKLDFKLTANGSITEPKIRLDSSIEKLFQKAIGEKVKQKAQKLTGKVKAAIGEKIGDISSLDNFTKDFDGWDSQIADKDALLKNLLGKIKF